MASTARDERAWDLSGWGEIAQMLGCAERTAMRAAARPEGENPLPVSRVFGGNIVAVRSEIAEWSRAEMKRGKL